MTNAAVLGQYVQELLDDREVRIERVAELEAALRAIIDCPDCIVARLKNPHVEEAERLLKNRTEP